MVISDIDYTLADARRRSMIALGVEKVERPLEADEIDVFYSRDLILQDPLIKYAKRCLDLLSEHNHKIYLLTGRHERNRSLTMEWLKKKRVKFDELIMRPDGMLVMAHKISFIRSMASVNGELWVVDDDDKVIMECRSIGITKAFKAPEGWKEMLGLLR